LSWAVDSLSIKRHLDYCVKTDKLDKTIINPSGFNPIKLKKLEKAVTAK